MKGEVLTSMESAAYGAKLSFVEAVPDFPAPFSSKISDKLSKIHNCDIFETESAGSAIAAALGCAAAGKRAFVPVSSPLTQEAFTAPFLRLPFLLANVSKSLHNVASDHSAVLALRDAGYLMFFPETNQEIYDTILQAYKVIEDSKVLLPAIVNIDGLPTFSEVVQVATEQSTKTWLAKFKPRLDAKKPTRIDVYSDHYEEAKLAQHKSLEASVEVMKKVDEQWKQKFRRSYSLVEKFMMDDAETIIVIMGYHSSTAKAAVRAMRAAGKKVGLLRIRVFRPWPVEVETALATAKKVLVFDQAIAPGLGGILTSHIKRSCSSLICLGKYPSEKDFSDAIDRVEKSEKDVRLWL